MDDPSVRVIRAAAVDHHARADAGRPAGHAHAEARDRSFIGLGREGATDEVAPALRRVGGAVSWRSRAAWRVYFEKVPFALLSAASAALSIIALSPPRQLSLTGKLAASAFSLRFYLGKRVCAGSSAAASASMAESPQRQDWSAMTLPRPAADATR